MKIVLTCRSNEYSEIEIRDLFNISGVDKCTEIGYICDAKKE